MRLIIGAVGRMKTGPDLDLYERYAARMRALGRAHQIAGPDLIEIDESRARNGAQRREDEAVRLFSHMPQGAALVLLEETGKDLTTIEFTGILRHLRDDGAPAVMFAIGGPDGHGAALRGAARYTLRFGRLTWPHMLARIMLAEQLYRALTVLAGHPYHRS